MLATSLSALAIAMASAHGDPGPCLPKSQFLQTSCDCTKGMFIISDENRFKGLVVCPHECDEERRECLCPEGHEAVATDVGKVCREPALGNATKEQEAWLAIVHDAHKMWLIDASFAVAEAFESEKRILKIEQLTESGRVLVLFEESAAIHEVVVSEGRMTFKNSGLAVGDKILSNFAYDENLQCLVLLSPDRIRVCLREECTQWLTFTPERDTRKLFFVGKKLVVQATARLQFADLFTPNNTSPVDSEIGFSLLFPDSSVVDPKTEFFYTAIENAGLVDYVTFVREHFPSARKMSFMIRRDDVLAGYRFKSLVFDPVDDLLWRISLEPPALLAINPASPEVLVKDLTGCEGASVAGDGDIGLIVNVKRADVFKSQSDSEDCVRDRSSWMTYAAVMCVSAGVGYGLSRLAGRFSRRSKAEEVLLSA